MKLKLVSLVLSFSTVAHATTASPVGDITKKVGAKLDAAQFASTAQEAQALEAELKELRTRAVAALETWRKNRGSKQAVRAMEQLNDFRDKIRFEKRPLLEAYHRHFAYMLKEFLDLDTEYVHSKIGTLQDGTEVGTQFRRHVARENLDMEIFDPLLKDIRVAEAAKAINPAVERDGAKILQRLGKVAKVGLAAGAIIGIGVAWYAYSHPSSNAATSGVEDAGMRDRMRELQLQERSSDAPAVQ